jgi:hypothetical protein
MTLYIAVYGNRRGFSIGTKELKGTVKFIFQPVGRRLTEKKVVKIRLRQFKQIPK